jgi:Flp pilus assembly pilin Flp
MLNLIMGKFVAAIHDRKGISAMEYGILAAAIIGVVGTAAATIGTDLGTLMNKVINSLVNAGG